MLARLIDFVAAIWIIGAAVFLVYFSPFLFDSPYATIWTALLTLLQMLFLFAGIPVAWVVIRILQHVRTRAR